MPKIKIYTGGVAIIPENSTSDIQITGDLVDVIEMDETQVKEYKKPAKLRGLVEKHKRRTQRGKKVN